MAVVGELTWGETSATTQEGATVSVSYSGLSSANAPTAASITTALNGVAEATTVANNSVTFRGLSEGAVTIPLNTHFQTSGGLQIAVSNALTITVTAAAPKYLDKDGLDYYDSLIATEIGGKQDTLTAGTGISITNNVISATGGGEADSVAWGHITGTLSNQTDLNTALGAKANTADLATVATSGSYNDLTNKPTIPSLTRRTSTSAPATVGSLVLGGNGTSTLPYAFPTIVGTNDESFWSYIRTTDITNGISEAYLGAYEYDPTENWWSGKKEARLALYSDIPTVGNATLTIQKNGTSAGTFTANATSNKTINITVPTDADDVGALPDTTKYGASISVSVNTTDYKVTTTLKDQDGNTLGTAQVIDLPLESVVVNGSYDSTNKKIVLTLQNGNTIDIPVADLVAGLQSEITSTNMLDADLVDDSTSINKFVTAAQITKLNGIAAGAEVNVQSDWSQTTTTADDYIKNKPTKVSDFTNDAGYITSYTDTQVTQTRVDPSAITTFYPVASTSSTTNTGDVKKFSAVKLNYVNDDGGRAELELGQNSYYDPVYGELTLWDVGPSSQHKTTLRRALDATNQTFYFPYNADSTGGTLVANGSLTTGTGSATNPVYADSDGILHATTYALNATVPSNAVFTDTTYSDATTSTAGLMSASDKTKLNGIAAGAEVNVQSDWNVTSTSSDAFIKNKPTIPTKTSDLTNDSGFITSYTETDPIYSASAAAGITSTDITNWNNKSDFSGSYTDLTNKPTIGNATLTIQKNGTNVQTFTANATSNKTANITVPTKTSDLTNDSGFLDSVAWGDVTGKPTFATVATSGSYNDLTNKPTIPAAITVDSAISSSSTNPVQNKVISDALDLKANAADVSTALAGKQAALTAGSHISLSGSTISAVDYVHSESPVSTQAVTPVVTNNMIADGTITAAKLASGAVMQLTMSTSDIGEGAALAANTLYGVYE